MGRERNAARWRRVRGWWRAYHWWVVGGAVVVATALGFLGFRDYLGSDAGSNWDFLYLSIQLFVLESGGITGPAPLTLEVARLLAPVVSAYAVLAVVMGIFRDELVGLRTRLWRGHVIVCGLEAGWALTRMVRAQGKRVIVIERDGAHPRIETCREQHIPVIVGDARDEHLLRKVGIGRASRLFAVCGDDDVNMKVARLARGLAGDRGPDREPLRVLVHLADPYMCRVLRILELRKGRVGSVQVEFFSVFDRGAKAMLADYPAFGTGETPPHMLVVGLGRLGQQLVVHAARSWRVDREHPETGDALPAITVVDADADEKVEQLKQRHPFLETACRLQPEKTPPDCAGIVGGASLLLEDGGPGISSAYVCLDDDVDGLFVALGLRELLGPRGAPVVVRIYDPDVGSTLPDVESAPQGGLQVFGLFDRTCRADLMHNLLEWGMWGILAREIHDRYRQHEKAKGETEESNPSIVPWDRLPDDLKESNLGQAQHTKDKLERLNCGLAPLTGPETGSSPFTPGEIEILAEMEHERWVAEQDAAGWTEGPRDPVKKTKPTLAPWERLPEDEREKDRAFVRALPSLLASVGLRIVRPDEVQSHPEGSGTPEPTRHAGGSR